VSEPIVLEARLGLPQAEALLDRLRQPDALSEELAFDASGVEESSAAWIAVLIGFLQARPDSTAPVRVIDPSSEFVDAFSDLGLFQDLMRMEFS